MRRVPSGWLLPLLLVLGCGSPRSSAPPSEAVAVAPPAVPTTDAEELRAFAKLYGYVRFFHPSDEAAAADWERPGKPAEATLPRPGRRTPRP